MSDRLATRLEGIVGASHVLSDPDVRSGYEVDWTKRFRGESSFVVRPRDVEEVAALVRLAHEEETPLVAQGGNTGLVGGSVPSHGAVVLSTERMTDLSEVDEGEGTVRAGAGVTLENVDSRAERAGLFFPISHAGASRATVGGTIATNAGGVLSWRFGNARHHVRGVEAVLGDGTVVDRLDARLKDNAGYDFTALLCGSEGTLGIVTRATLDLAPRPDVVRTAAIGLERPDSLSDFARSCRRTTGMWSAEVVFPEALANACELLGLPAPFDGDGFAYAFVRCVGEDAEARLGELAGDRPSALHERVWDLRERQNEAAGAAGVRVKLDVSVPVDSIESFVAAVASRADKAGVTPLVYGHLLDGNLHVNLVGGAAEDLEEPIVRSVAEAGGSIAAEHGIGRMKARWLSLVRSEDEIAAMRAVKRALDPHGILNPGVLFGG